MVRRQGCWSCVRRLTRNEMSRHRSRPTWLRTAPSALGTGGSPAPTRDPDVVRDACGLRPRITPTMSFLFARETNLRSNAGCRFLRDRSGETSTSDPNVLVGRISCEVLSYGPTSSSVARSVQAGQACRPRAALRDPMLVAAMWMFVGTADPHTERRAQSPKEVQHSTVRSTRRRERKPARRPPIPDVRQGRRLAPKKNGARASFSTRRSSSLR